VNQSGGGCSARSGSFTARLGSGLQGQQRGSGQGGSAGGTAGRLLSAVLGRSGPRAVDDSDGDDAAATSCDAASVAPELAADPLLQPGVLQAVNVKVSRPQRKAAHEAAW
jgi:surface antigen